MKVILLEDIKGLGKKYDVKDVASGYARNFLLPRKLIEPATKEALAKLEKEKAAWEEKRKKLVAELEEKARKFKDTILEFKVKVGKKGEVFGSVTKRDVQDLLKEKGMREAEAKLEQPIKTLGEHDIALDLGEGVKTKIKVRLEKEIGPEKEKPLLSSVPSHYLDDLNELP